MGLEQTRKEILKAANLMHRSDGSQGPELMGPSVVIDVVANARAAEDELSATVPVFARQREIKSEAEERFRRVQAKLLEAQGELAALTNLYDEGIAGGREIFRHSEGANGCIDSAGDIVFEAQNLADTALGQSRSLRVFSPATQQLVLLENSVPAMVALGQRHIDHFSAINEKNTNLIDEFARLGNDVTEMLGQITRLGESPDQYARMAEQGEPQRTIDATDDLAKVASSTATELRNFAANPLT